IKHAPPGNDKRTSTMSKPYISYIDPKTMKDAAMLAELERCKSYGTPRPESQAIRAHVPAVFWSFANYWRASPLCVLVLRQLLARRVPYRRCRPRHQGAVPALCVALSSMSILWNTRLEHVDMRRDTTPCLHDA